MLKNTDKYDNTTHFTYDDYKRKVKKRPNKDMMIFVSVFAVGVLIILGFAKLLSPNVDVGISSESDKQEIIEDETENRTSSIDERLKKLKMEDDGEIFSPELDEKVVLPKSTEKEKVKQPEESGQTQPISVVDSALKTLSEQAKNNEAAKTAPPKAEQPATTAKVVIGSYATEKQAEVAKTVLKDSGLGVTPIIKNIGGTYTLQVGAYSTKEKAQQASNNLIKNNYPARVVE